MVPVSVCLPCCRGESDFAGTWVAQSPVTLHFAPPFPGDVRLSSSHADMFLNVYEKCLCGGVRTEEQANA